MTQTTANDAAAQDELLIPRGAHFDGMVAFRGSARIEGQLVGEIVAEGCLVIGPQGRVDGSVDIDELVIEGALEGDARARRSVRLGATARVRGGVFAPRVSAAEGCVWDGPCRTGNSLEVGKITPERNASLP